MNNSSRVLILSIFFVFFSASIANGAVWSVTNNGDSAGDPTTLRGVLNRAASGDSILVAGVGTISLASGALMLDKDITIDGGGVEIKAAPNSRVMEIRGNLSADIKDMSFVNGNAATGNGGGVLVGNIIASSIVNFTRCTFAKNIARNRGGGAYIDSMSKATFENCTFFDNEAIVQDGGGVANNDHSTIIFRYVTMTNNRAAAHGAVCNYGNATYEANIFVGNSAPEILPGSAISLGNNLVGDNSLGGYARPTDMANVPAANIFDTSPPALARNNAVLTQPNWGYTVALKNIPTNIAIFPVSPTTPSFDQRLVAKGVSGNACSGSYELEALQPLGDSLIIGSIPNSLMTIGHTVQMASAILPASADQRVIWGSTDPSVAVITPGGTLYSLSAGITNISADSVALGAGGKTLKSRSIMLKVSKNVTRTNLHPDVAALLTIFNIGISASGQNLQLAIDKLDFTTTSPVFRADFAKEYGFPPTALLTLPASADFHSRPASGNEVSLAMSLRVNSPSRTAILPLTMTFAVPAGQIAEAFFRNGGTLVMKGASGKIVTLIDNGTNGINFQTAINEGILSPINVVGTSSFMLSGWFADVEGKPKIINNQLVIPDGAADGFLDGEFVLVGKGGTPPPPPSGGGGGGCNASLGLFVFLLAIPAIYFLSSRPSRL